MLFELPPSIQRFANELGAIPGVVGIVLGGSRARDDQQSNSDYDIGLYYLPNTFNWHSVISILQAHCDDHSPRGLGAPGEWGLWMNGGAWLKIQNHAVDILLRDIEFI